MQHHSINIKEAANTETWVLPLDGFVGIVFAISSLYLNCSRREHAFHFPPLSLFSLSFPPSLPSIPTHRPLHPYFTPSLPPIWFVLDLKLCLTSPSLPMADEPGKRHDVRAH